MTSVTVSAALLSQEGQAPFIKCVGPVGEEQLGPLEMLAAAARRISRVDGNVLYFY